MLAARERLGTELAAAEVLYAARDPFSRKVVIDKGSQHDIRAGQAVVDNRGVVGQVTRVYPWLSEVTLVTDKGQFVPVQNLRNGLRAVLSGTGSDGALELRFIPLNADFQNGDELVTSGIDGVYPPGLPVARVTHVERIAAQLFARITGAPLGGVASHAHVLIVGGSRDAAAAAGRRAESRRGPRNRGKADGRHPRHARRKSCCRSGPASSSFTLLAALLLNLLPWSGRGCGSSPISSRWCCSTGASSSRARSVSSRPGCWG